MGLLDLSFDNLDDPKKQMLLAMAAGLLTPQHNRGLGGFGAALGQAVPMGLNQYAQASMMKQKMGAAEQEKKMREMQLEQMRNEQQFRVALGGAMQPSFAPTQTFSPSDMETPSQYTPGGPAGLNTQSPAFLRAMQLDPMKAISAQQAFASMSQKQIHAMKPDESLGIVENGTWKPIATNPKPKEQWRPLSVAELKEKGLPTDGRQGWQIDTATGKVAAVGAVAPNINVPVHLGNSLASTLGKGIGDALDAGKAQATGAIDSINTGNAIKQAIESGKVIAGPLANGRIVTTQIANALGFTGDEGLVQTRTVIANMANSALAARGMLKGQGQVSDYESKLLEKAKAGSIDLTVPEIKALVNVNERLSRSAIQRHMRLVGELSKNPDYKQAIPFYSVEEPPAYTSSGSSGPVVGAIEDGYIFLGGDPKDKNNWKRK